MMRDEKFSRYDYDDINIHARSAIPRLSKGLSWLLDIMHIRNVLTDPDNHTATGPGWTTRPLLSRPRERAGACFEIRNSQEQGGRGGGCGVAYSPADTNGELAIEKRGIWELKSHFSLFMLLNVVF